MSDVEEKLKPLRLAVAEQVWILKFNLIALISNLSI